MKLTSTSADPVIGITIDPAPKAPEPVLPENVLFTISMAIPELEAL
jgi:hypothetical protein